MTCRSMNSCGGISWLEQAVLVDQAAEVSFADPQVNKTVSTGAMRRLVAYDWPGKVRELRNVVERAIILSGNKPEICPEHLTFGIHVGQVDLSGEALDPGARRRAGDHIRLQTARIRPP